MKTELDRAGLRALESRVVGADGNDITLDDLVLDILDRHNGSLKYEEIIDLFRRELSTDTVTVSYDAAKAVVDNAMHKFKERGWVISGAYTGMWMLSDKGKQACN